MTLLRFFLRLSWPMVLLSTLIGSISGICSALLMALVSQRISTSHNPTLQTLLLFAGLLGTVVFTGIISQWLLIQLSQTAVYRLREQLSQKILAAPLRQLESLGASRLLASLTEDVNDISDAVQMVPLICLDSALILGCLAYLGWIAWPVLLLLLLFIGAASVVMQGLFFRSERILTQAREAQDHLFGHFRSMTEGIKELKLHHPRQQAFLTEELGTTAMAWQRHNVASAMIFGISLNIAQFLFFAILGFLIFVLPYLKAVDTGTLSGFLLVITYVMAPLKRVMAILPELGKASVAFQNVEALGLSLANSSLTNDSLIKDSLAKEPENYVASAVNSPSIQPLPYQHHLSFSNVSYRYSINEVSTSTDTKHQNLEDTSFSVGPLNLKLVPGEIVFIVGGNGSGKSTLAKLLTGLYTPDSGECWVDGVKVTDGNRDRYRQLFSTVYADFYLFDRFLGLNAEPLKERVQYYLERLQLDHKVQINGDRLSTLNLSQGQRKRLALLTAYLEDRPIYLFDEWAADQDPYFKSVFYTQLLPELKQRGKTVLVISHDDRYFHLADRLIQLDYGQIVDRPPDAIAAFLASNSGLRLSQSQAPITA